MQQSVISEPLIFLCVDMLRKPRNGFTRYVVQSRIFSFLAVHHKGRRVPASLPSLLLVMHSAGPHHGRQVVRQTEHTGGQSHACFWPMEQCITYFTRRNRWRLDGLSRAFRKWCVLHLLRISMRRKAMTGRVRKDTHQTFQSKVKRTIPPKKSYNDSIQTTWGNNM